MTDRHTRQESISEKNEREQAMTAIGSGNQLLKDAAKGVRGTVRASKRQGETGRGKGGGGGGGGGGGSGGGGTKGASGSGVQTSGGEGSGRGKGNNHRHSSGGRGSGSHDGFATKQALILHYSRVHARKEWPHHVFPFPCPKGHCKFRSSTKLGMTRHIEREH